MKNLTKLRPIVLYNKLIFQTNFLDFYKNTAIVYTVAVVQYVSNDRDNLLTFHFPRSHWMIPMMMMMSCLV